MLKPDVSKSKLKSNQQPLTMIKKNYKKDLQSLSGGVAVINVGGSTEVEVKERKDRVDDALNATRAAVEEGIVPGGGTALLYSIKALEGAKGANADQNAGIDIVRAALEAPCRQISENAGVEGSIVIGKLSESKDVSSDLMRKLKLTPT